MAGASSPDWWRHSHELGTVSSYWQIFHVGIQNTLAYRANFFVRALFNLVPLTAMLAMWRVIYEGKSGDIAGYSLQEMASYYLLATLVEAMTCVTEDDWQISAEIKDGQISQFLMRPIDYLHYRFSLFWSGRVVYALAALAPTGLFIAWNHELLLPPPDSSAFACLLLSLVLSAILQFLLSCIVAMLAFWVLEISTFVFVLLAFERLTAGQMFPLDLLPGWLTHALMWTPFPYCTYFPVSIYLGNISGAALVNGLLMQVFWVATIYGIARAMWCRGLKTYTVVGG
ncbi:MAG: ABC-2 family transporter protein [Verrucomicrobiales bacterium]|nr:ABC-2 family transporter protein [Verrucomicrobiales bacterium]